MSQLRESKDTSIRLGVGDVFRLRKRLDDDGRDSERSKTMTIVALYGHSDDLIEIEGGAGNDEIPAPKTPHTISVCGVTIVAEYDGVWTFDVVSKPSHVNVMAVPNHAIDKEWFNRYTELLVVKVS